MVARAGGFVAGLAVAASFVVAGLTPASETHLGAEVTFQTLPTGDLAVDPEGRFLEASNLDPSGPAGAARGVSTLTNQTAIPLALRARVLPSSRNLDDLLRVRITAAGKRIFDGMLGQLREWTQRSIRLASGKDAEIVVLAWLPPSVREGYEARGTKLTLIWKTHAVVFE
jgi:hypothetical protein